MARGQGYSLFLTPTAAVLSLSEKTNSAVVRMQLKGSNPSARVRGDGDLPGKTNYLTGSNPANWRTKVPTYSRVRYDGVYPGIDLIYYGNQRELEYDFVVAPGAEPGRIRMSFNKDAPASIDANGDLVFNKEAAALRFHKPIAYQIVNGTRREVAAEFALLAGH